MGRGRAKAKQTKVARELKYNSPNMDLDRLKADLGVNGTTTRSSTTESDDPNADDEYDDDEYSAYLADDDD
ncbi:DUF3073 domain-containing protein [Frankia sp. AgB1.9]|jgi:hypothetical protein|uniref:DUF3073 domain-containing protein n=1 Tax=unclassified Frankia TaxID=2632575 RepID=UPI001931805C|nr:MULTISPECIES: DUF3073 domain-containing protein [unclassified Frankia]MBL7487803.1 DUF3073 domain-containing protein [Frankia sp. AgW1.1]MBL7547364.1 DUF3073 domain-containing protein [Frankia sp. AgB1.9]MBL7624565.1 DUF3073 domain-containing protein [Frankia sp. AgB1.8]